MTFSNITSCYFIMHTCYVAADVFTHVLYSYGLCTDPVLPVQMPIAHTVTDSIISSSTIAMSSF